MAPIGASIFSVLVTAHEVKEEWRRRGDCGERDILMSYLGFFCRSHKAMVESSLPEKRCVLGAKGAYSLKIKISHLPIYQEIFKKQRKKREKEGYIHNRDRV